MDPVSKKDITLDCIEKGPNGERFLVFGGNSDNALRVGIAIPPMSGQDLTIGTVLKKILRQKSLFNDFKWKDLLDLFSNPEMLNQVRLKIQILTKQGNEFRPVQNGVHFTPIIIGDVARNRKFQDRIEIEKVWCGSKLCSVSVSQILVVLKNPIMQLNTILKARFVLVDESGNLTEDPNLAKITNVHVDRGIMVIVTLPAQYKDMVQKIYESGFYIGLVLFMEGASETRNEIPFPIPLVEHVQDQFCPCKMPSWCHSSLQMKDICCSYRNANKKENENVQRMNSNVSDGSKIEEIFSLLENEQSHLPSNSPQVHKSSSDQNMQSDSDSFENINIDDLLTDDLLKEPDKVLDQTEDLLNYLENDGSEQLELDSLPTEAMKIPDGNVLDSSMNMQILEDKPVKKKSVENVSNLSSNMQLAKPMEDERAMITGFGNMDVKMTTQVRTVKKAVRSRNDFNSTPYGGVRPSCLRMSTYSVDSMSVNRKIESTEKVQCMIATSVKKEVSDLMPNMMELETKIEPKIEPKSEPKSEPEAASPDEVFKDLLANDNEIDKMLKNNWPSSPPTSKNIFCTSDIEVDGLTSKPKSKYEKSKLEADKSVQMDSIKPSNRSSLDPFTGFCNKIALFILVPFLIIMIYSYFIK